MNENIDNDETTSLPDFHLNGLEVGKDGKYQEYQKKEHGRARIERRFIDMNPRIGEMTSFVETLNEKLTSNNKEVNDLNVLSSATSIRSDKVVLTTFFTIIHSALRNLLKNGQNLLVSQNKIDSVVSLILKNVFC